MAIKKDYLVTKRNVLNELRANNMTLQELRFFSIYLSKINHKNLNTRVVRFSLSDFQTIMELGRININYLKQITNSLLCKVVNIPLDENGSYTAFQLFKKCTVNINENGERYIEIDAHDDTLPLMFEFKNKFFSYKLWNALRLKSANQLRMYEILKQYEKIGERIICVEELKELLGIDKKEYQRFGNFKVRILDSCQEALKKYTDIKFTYEAYGKKGRGGKVLTLKFTIQKNENYENPLSLEQFINLEEQSHESEADLFEQQFQEKLEFLNQACNNEFSIPELTVIYNLLIKILPYNLSKEDIELYNYIKRKYDELNWRASYTKITHRFNYLKKVLEAEANV